jgi:hypothetical protein
MMVERTIAHDTIKPISEPVLDSVSLVPKYLLSAMDGIKKPISPLVTMANPKMEAD